MQSSNRDLRITYLGVISVATRMGVVTFSVERHDDPARVRRTRGLFKLTTLDPPGPLLLEATIDDTGEVVKQRSFRQVDVRVYRRFRAIVNEHVITNKSLKYTRW